MANYSFSGADASAVVWFPQYPSGARRLDSVHTISVSVHEGKGMARALGFKGVRGFARGIRTIAGSLILTVINDHPLRPLLDQYTEAFVPSAADEDARYPLPPGGWSRDDHLVGVGSGFNTRDFTSRLGVTLPAFNMIIQYVSEGSEATPVLHASGEDITFEVNDLGQVFGSAAQMIVGIELMDEGTVTSVNDIVTEITYSFVALDFKPLSSATHTVKYSDYVEFTDEQDQAFWDELGLGRVQTETVAELISVLDSL